MREHFVQFYSNDNFLVNQVAAFVRAGIDAGESALIIPTHLHRNAIEKRLRDRSPPTDPKACEAFDAAHLVSRFMSANRPSKKRFFETMTPLLEAAAARGNGHVRVFGEMVGVLWLQGKHEAAIQLEKFWNELITSHSATFFCAYPIAGFPREADSNHFLSICNEHSHVLPAENYTPPTDASQYFRTIALLQQKAVALETEVALRKKVEDVLQQREQQLAALEGGQTALHA